MNQECVKYLGSDLLWCKNPDAAKSVLQGRTRFLDHLWLPSPLAELSEDQILIINRYRESVMEADDQYLFARRARLTLARVASTIDAHALVEIGCGKFPIEAPCKEYLGVDIDPEAILAVQERGKKACQPAELENITSMSVDFVASAYAMHFSISDSLLANLARIATSDALFCFNLIVDESITVPSLLARLGSDWPLLQVIKTTPMARREFFFVAGRLQSHARFFQAANAIRHDAPGKISEKY